MNNCTIYEKSWYDGILMKQCLPAEVGKVFRSRVFFFCLSMPNNAHKYILLSDFTFAKWPLRGWPYFASVLCHSSNRCTYIPADQVYKHIYYAVAYLLLGGGGGVVQDVWQTRTKAIVRGCKSLSGVYESGVCMGVDCCTPNVEETTNSVFLSIYSVWVPRYLPHLNYNNT